MRTVFPVWEYSWATQSFGTINREFWSSLLRAVHKVLGLALRESIIVAKSKELKIGLSEREKKVKESKKSLWLKKCCFASHKNNIFVKSDFPRYRLALSIFFFCHCTTCFGPKNIRVTDAGHRIHGLTLLVKYKPCTSLAEDTWGWY
jgi:hypothetical protein